MNWRKKKENDIIEDKVDVQNELDCKEELKKWVEENQDLLDEDHEEGSNLFIFRDDEDTILLDTSILKNPTLSFKSKLMSIIIEISKIKTSDELLNLFDELDTISNEQALQELIDGKFIRTEAVEPTSGV